LHLGDGPGPETVSAISGGLSDTWRFRRESLQVVAPEAAIPAGQAGLWNLVFYPNRALAVLGTAWPPKCEAGAALP
jgi:hypothetical protein